MSQVIVVGGGLGGMSAAHTALQAGAKVIVIDKSPFCGGNSTKATSGINGAGSRTQRVLGIPDSVQIFEADTTKSASTGARPDLIKALTHNSGPSIDWLMDSFDLKLDVVSRMAAHTIPRTHRGGAGGQFPGMMITYGLMEALDDIADASPETARVVNKATVTELLRDASGKVVGVEYTKKGKSFKEYGSVVLATGGFGADFSANSLLSSVAQDWRGLAVWDSMDHKLLPDLGDLPTTNGPHCTGDGIKMATSLGAGVRDLHCVQVHPTGIIDPEDKDAKVKRLAAEALRGHGGILLDRDGNRFANELGKRDYVSGRMWAQDRAPYRLVLNSASTNEIAWHCKHYSDNGLMKKLSGKELAADMGIPYGKLEQTFGEYSASAKQHKATGKPDKWGKVFFEYSPGGIHVADSPVVADDHFHVAQVTPIVHYCMGGISTSAAGEVLTTGEQPIPGLFAAGEVIGGIHGVNRLGGSSLLDCVVYGRLAGASAAKSVGQGTGNINNLTGKGPSPSVVAKPASSGAPAVYTMAEVAKHTTKDDCWVVVDGNVYDVTEFLEDHPGGARVIVKNAGKDSSEQFHMMHSAKIITKYGAEYKIGVASDALTSKL
jgi:succinate dehydrogenase/fumarate reductase flavoprotein subunit